MSFFTALYRLLIGPLELFFEVLYSQVNRILDNPGLSIVFLSLAMNFLVLPLYKMSDAMQAEEAAIEAKLRPTVTHIKKTFKGDERFMILQMYYRENHYKPTDVLKGSVSLLLEIPFFMAAYNFLSGLPALNGASFGPIRNLAVPDGMLVIGSAAIHLLPILMTVINLISSAIYTKGASTRSKVQLYVMAGLFLVLLYDSPSGLVFYWTLNNLFSLVKNIFMKLRNPRKVFGWLCSAIGGAAFVFVLVTHPMPTARSQFLLCCMTLLLQLPVVVYDTSQRWHHESTVVLTKKDHRTFWIGGLFLTVLTGLFIPSGVISASPEEFLNPVTHANPLIYLLGSTLTAAGFFLIWFGVFYLLAKNSGKKWMNYGMCALSFIAVVDFMFFGKNYGNMSANLVFDVAPVYTQKLLNLLVIGAVAGIVYLIWRKKQQLLRFVMLAAALAAVAISAVNMTQIQRVTAEKTEQIQQISADLPEITLSKNGKNVIVLMLDRGVGAYVPYIMNEKPQLKEQFQGFTYYPNVISYGPSTNIGAPALYGGYEYTPEKMNERAGESLEEKTNEALKVMPALFYSQGYQTTVCDPPYAGYDWTPDLSIYSDYPRMKCYNTKGRFDEGTLPKEKFVIATRMRNFFCYSIFKAAPVFLEEVIYSGGTYHNTQAVSHQKIGSLSAAEGMSDTFMAAYNVLNNLKNITKIENKAENTFLMFTNDTTHEPALLQMPMYEPREKVDNSMYMQDTQQIGPVNGVTLEAETVKQITHYHVNVAAFLKVGEWLDHLKAEGVYDNTRIIIVSDHGALLEQLDNAYLPTEQTDDIMLYNPLLLVKDFHSSEEFTVDPAFMTNADTPSLAVQGLMEEPENPFTHKPISSGEKYAAPPHILCSRIFDIGVNHGHTFLPGPWLSVHDNIFDLDNWEYLGSH